MTTAAPPRRRPHDAQTQVPLSLFQSAYLLMGNYHKAERWFESNHPLLSSSPRNAVNSPNKAHQLGALMEAASKGWPL